MRDCILEMYLLYLLKKRALVYFIGRNEWFILRACLEAQSVEVKCVCMSANSVEQRSS
jgi:hypothetical protein